MIYSTQELYAKYSQYKTPHVKIQTEVRNGRLFPVARGLYEDDHDVPGYLLTSYIRPQAYLSFEFVLERAGLIPERVFLNTAATVGKSHSTLVQTSFGNFSFQDVPSAAYRFGVRAMEENGYAYLLASPEKALCDTLYKKPPVHSVKELKELLFDDMRVDEDVFGALSVEDLRFLCPLYRKKNLWFLKKLMEV